MANRRRNSSASRLPQNDTSRSTAPGGSSDRHPVYHGIRLRDGKWVPEIYEPNKTTRINLGTYPTPRNGSRSYDVAALALQGTKAVPNFTDSNSVISHMLPVDSTIEDICAEAARAAAARSPGYEYGSGSMTAGGSNTGPPRIDYNPPENGSDYDSGGSGNLWDY